MKPIRLLAILEATTITGPGKNLLQFARIARAGRFDPPVEVSVATFWREGDSDLFLNTAKQAGIATFPIAERGRFDRSVLQKLAALSGELAPDIIQTHAVKSHFLLRRAGLDRLYPWVAFHHGYTWPNLQARAYNQLDRWSLRAARRVVTVSRPFQDELMLNGVARERITVVHNAIDPEWGASSRTAAASLRSKLAIPPGRKVILIVGRLSREKDHWTLLHVIDRIRKHGIVAPHLVIVGEGPERKRIEDRIRALDLASYVTLTGHVPSAEPYYGIADAAVLSSRSEGSPNALLEAMAARVPVVATAVGGIPEIVSNGESALLVASGDCEGMAGAVTALLTDQVLAGRVTGRARELVETQHDPESRARTLGAIYQSMLQR
jgi:glycosyltransferase involved in cell wall biosynthesis